jgi:hypothetical protein
MTRNELVRRAVSFDHPPRIPVWFWNQDRDRSDIHGYELFPYKADAAIRKSEWGYEWEDLGDGTLGQPKHAVIPSWNDAGAFDFPSADKPGRFDGMADFVKRAEDRYRAAEMGITGFNTYTFLRGFENALVDFKLERKRAEFLLDRIFDFETEVIRLAASHGFDAIHFADDWGTQQSLIIDPGLWRSLFKPRYARQFQVVHDLGMHVWFHCCGNITEIVRDFYEAGVDVMNISQPNAVDIARVGRLLRGKQCFMVPVSYQTVSISGSPDAIREEARRLFDALGTQRGGFIGYVEEYSVMGMPGDNYRACAAAFEKLL